MKSILIIEDDLPLACKIQEYFKNKYHFSIANNPKDALCLLDKSNFDLVLLDFNFGSENENGHAFMDSLKNINFQKPIIVISGEINIQMSIGFLKRQIQDFLEKPFSLSELDCCIEKHLNQNNSLIQQNGFYLNPELQCAFIEDRKISLTPTEFEILSFFIENKNKQIKRDSISNLIWPDTVVSKNTFDTHLLNLKKKIPPFAEKLETIYRVGYVYEQ